MDLALFDLDNTLIAGDSDFEWAQFLIGKGILDRALYEAKNIEFYEQYKAGTLDIDIFLDFQLRPLAAHPAVGGPSPRLARILAARVPFPTDPAIGQRTGAAAGSRASRQWRPVRHRHCYQQLRHRSDRPRPVRSSASSESRI